MRVRLTRNSEDLGCCGVVAYVSSGLGMGSAFDEPLPPAQLSILERWLLDAACSSS